MKGWLRSLARKPFSQLKRQKKVIILFEKPRLLLEKLFSLFSQSS
jgi:hypothetical protein